MSHPQGAPWSLTIWHLDTSDSGNLRLRLNTNPWSIPLLGRCNTFPSSPARTARESIIIEGTLLFVLIKDLKEEPGIGILSMLFGYSFSFLYIGGEGEDKKK